MSIRIEHALEALGFIREGYCRNPGSDIRALRANAEQKLAQIHHVFPQTIFAQLVDKEHPTITISAPQLDHWIRIWLQKGSPELKNWYLQNAGENRDKAKIEAFFEDFGPPPKTPDAKDIAAPSSAERVETTRKASGPANDADTQAPATRPGTPSQSADAVRNVAAASAYTKHRSDRPLANRIINYWYDCIRSENVLEKGISIFSRSKALLYPFDADHILFGSGTIDVSGQEKVRSFATNVSSQGQAAYYGYPLLFYQDESSGKWEVAPLFVVEVGFVTKDGRLFAARTDPFPSCGVNALTRLGLQGEQVSDLNEQLRGRIGDGSSKPQETLDRCVEILETEVELNLQESLAPDNLSTDRPLSKTSRPGIYNKSMFFAGDEAGYNINLLKDLKTLTQKGDLDTTSLGALLQMEAPPSSAEDQLALPAPLLPFPLNEYQLNALLQILSRRLSVVTGPPGTGKSQFIADLMINILFAGKSVLLVSHTNEAVDVVTRKFEGYPGLLLRTGRNEIRQDLNRQFSELQIQAAQRRRNEKAAWERVTALWKEIQQLRISLRQRADLAQQLDQDIADHGRRSDLFAGHQEVLRTYTSDVSGWHRTVGLMRKLRSILDGESTGRRSFWASVARMFIPGHTVRRKRILFERIVMVCPNDIAALVDPASGLKGLGTFDDRRWSRLVLYMEMSDLWRKVLRTRDDVLRLEPRQPLSHALRQAEEQYYALCRSLVAEQYAHRAEVGYAGSANQYLDQVVRGRSGEELSEFAFAHAIKALPLWSCTLKSLRRSFPLAANIFDYVVFDEASQVDLPSAAPALYRGKQAIVVGDPMQLTHIASMSRQVEEKLSTANGLRTERDLYPGRIRYTDKSLYKSAEHSPWSPPTILLNHYRSEDSIARLFNSVFYGRRLHILTPRNRVELPSELGPSLRWIDCKGEARKISSGSRVNDDEVMLVVKTAVWLLHHVEGKDLTLGIVTPFSAQQDAIHRALLKKVSTEAFERHKIQVLTAHKFQGSEKDLMIASLVVAARGNGNSDGWFNGYPQILNVALSRARSFLCVIGDKEYCRSRPKILGRLVKGFVEIETEKQEDAATLGRTIDSPAERELFQWLVRSKLEQLHYRLVPKYVAKRYTLDFALIGPTFIDIECDGLQHEIVGGIPVIEDVERDAYLTAKGWQVVRVPNHRIWTEPEAVIREIVAIAQAGGESGRVAHAGGSET